MLPTRQATPEPRLVALLFGVAMAIPGTMAVGQPPNDGLMPLNAPTTVPTRVLPQHVIDAFALPEEPIRTASRRSLDWKPGLTGAAEPEREQKQKTEESSSDPQAEPEGPVLAPAAQQEAKPAPEASAEEQQKPEKAETEKSGEAKSPVWVAPSQKSGPGESDEPAAEKEAEESEERESEPLAEEVKDSEEETQANTTPAAPKAKEPPPPLSRSMQVLRTRLRTVLAYYYRKPLNSMEHDPWEVMHSMLSYELNSRVRDGGPRGRPITAVGYLCFNKPCDRKRMLYVNSDGELDVRVGVGLQGHRGQFLAMLAQCNVSPDYPIRIGERDFSIQDLAEAEQRTCYARSELTFKLIGLGHYLDSDARWVNNQGETWDIPRLIREERTQPIRGAACGGTHRLSGLSLAWRRREARGEPVEGEYLEAANFVRQYQQYAFRLQNRDGSLSTEWFPPPCVLGFPKYSRSWRPTRRPRS